MKRDHAALALATLALCLTACMQHTYVVGAGAPSGEIVYKNWHHHWLFGLVRPKLQEKVDIDALCPSGDAVVHQEVSFTNGLVDLLTAFVYSPTTVTVTCEGGEPAAMAAVTLTGEEAFEIASDPRFEKVVRRLAPERLEELHRALASR